MNCDTPRERLRAKIAEKKRIREKSYNNTTDFNKFYFTKNTKVLGFRKQQEFGLKKRIKP